MIGILVRQARERAGLTQAELAHMSGLERSNLSSIETGKRNVSISTLERILDSLSLRIIFIPKDQV